jgi:DNA-binding transcriptional regulator GbsR (MarR family)
MNNNFKREFIQRTGKIAKQWGLGEPVGKIWGILLLENRSLTQKEIAKHLDCSLSLISPSLTVMQKLGMISVIGKNGREKQYGAVVSFIDTFENVMKNWVDVEVKPLINLLESNIADADEKTKKRLNELLGECRRTGRIFNILSKIMAAKKSLEKIKIKFEGELK